MRSPAGHVACERPASLPEQRRRLDLPRTSAIAVTFDEWCSTVGAPVVESEPSGSGRVADEVVVVAWNVHVGGGDVEDFVRRLVRGDFTAGHPVPHYVLLLQEAFRTDDGIPPAVAGAPIPHAIPNDRQTVARRLQAHVAENLAISRASRARSGWRAPMFRSMRNGRGPAEDRGNAILSALPVDDVVAIRVAVRTSTTRCRRGNGPRHVLDRSGLGTRVVSVHLESGIPWTRGGPFAARTRQADALVDALGRFGSTLSWRPATSTPGSVPARQRYPSGRGVSGYAADRRSCHLELRVRARAPLDHVFARLPQGTIAVRRADGRFGSDHYPLIATVALSSRQRHSAIGYCAGAHTCNDSRHTDDTPRRVGRSRGRHGRPRCGGDASIGAAADVDRLRGDCRERWLGRAAASGTRASVVRSDAVPRATAADARRGIERRHPGGLRPVSSRFSRSVIGFA